jgi:hypothetical protein
MPIDRRRVKRERPPALRARGFWFLEAARRSRGRLRYPLIIRPSVITRGTRDDVSLDSPDPSPVHQDR